jgi:hypothetical protein
VGGPAGLGVGTALLLSGVFPALGVTVGVIRHRRLDVVGALVLAGIVVGTVLGLVSHSARLLLVEGPAPAAVFGVACLGSLWARHPISTVTPFLWVAIMSAWTVAYGTRRKKRGERMAATTGEETDVSNAQPPFPEITQVADHT